MGRNRKNQSAAVRFGPLLKAVLLCLLLGGSAVGYVWQKNQIHQLGQEIKKNEIKLEELRAANRRLGKQLITLRSPAVLERRITELGLGLTQPTEAQILRIVETPLVDKDLGPGPFYAAREAGREPASK